jgi:PIN domain nuclease of toxin-antitoxin system
MKLLLDTHTLIWWTSEKGRTGAEARRLIHDPATEVHVSVVSAWEIAIKVQRRTLSFDDTFLDAFDDRVAHLGWTMLPILASHAVAAARLPGSHKDPFDRLLAGQAIVENLTIATVDPQLATLGASVIW